MKDEKTFIMIDNTTFASAGRAIYYGNRNTEGGRHAEDYYRKYRDAILLDRQSLAEFLTALVLFDVLVWDGSSWHSQELEDAGSAADISPWVYSWFPQFEYAHENGIIDHILKRDEFNRFVSPYYRLGRATLLSLQWVKEHYAEYKSKLPRGFRTPLAYQSGSYLSRHNFDILSREEQFNLNEEELSVAMFLHRGLFYQSRIFSEDGWSYLPHSYRASLLSIPEIIGMSILCDDDSSFNMREQITGSDLLRSIDEHFQQELGRAIKMKPTPVGTAMGASFMQIHHEAYGAFREALSFRESRHGENVREQFRELVDLGRTSNRQSIENRIHEIDRSLRNEARSRFGTAWSSDPSTTYAINLIGAWKSIIEPVVNYLPLDFREGATKFLYKQFNRNGFQILFSHYL